MFWRIRFSAIAHLMKAPITGSSENVSDSQSSFYRRKYYHVFKKNVIGTHVWKNAHHCILFISFW